MNTLTTLLLACIPAAAFAMPACGDDALTAPSSIAIVTFGVQGETVRVSLTSAEQLAAARAAQSGGPARIPIGRIVAGAEANTGWTWHLEDVSLVEGAIEFCDRRPSDVERGGTQYGGGSYCPWTATIIRIDER